jgi:hypothetical protein
VLQPPHGVALVAAKAFYFGVGGSTAGFRQLVAADGVLECACVWQSPAAAPTEGSSSSSTGGGGGGSSSEGSVRREILRLSFPESISPYFL